MIVLPAEDRFAAEAAAITDLFELPVHVCATDPRRPQPSPLPFEADCVAAAAPKRQAEFAAGRAMARGALKALGGPVCAIPQGPDRAPQWPQGFAGSISHTTDLCAAVVTKVPATLGLDIEDATPLSADLIPLICTTAERARLSAPAAGHVAKRIFSAKEAVYKAQYPISGTLIGFDHVEVTFGARLETYQAKILKPLRGFATGQLISGRTAILGDHVISAAWTYRTEV